MEISSGETAQDIAAISSNDADEHQHDNVPDILLDQGVTETKLETVQDDVKSILEIIASTGKFWLDWDKLKSLLSSQLKQVLSEYAEAKMTADLQIVTLGETFIELVNRLDKALSSFIEGPPFTLQRLCEILLAARSIYPNLSKLSLALEKNLLVTSTLTICTDPYPPPQIPTLDEPEKPIEESQVQSSMCTDQYPQEIMQSPDEPEKTIEEPVLQSNTVVPNGVEAVVGDGDEIMTEVEETDLVEDMTIDMEAFEGLPRTSETSTD